MWRENVPFVCCTWETCITSVGIQLNKGHQMQHTSRTSRSGFGPIKMVACNKSSKYEQCQQRPIRAHHSGSWITFRLSRIAVTQVLRSSLYTHTRSMTLHMAHCLGTSILAVAAAYNVHTSHENHNGLPYHLLVPFVSRVCDDLLLCESVIKNCRDEEAIA